jgi:glycosyltransferase involved in cell wall biosynthesis
VVNGLWQYQSFGTWLALRNSGVPYFLFTHGMLDPWFKRQYPLKHLKKSLYWPWAEYRVVRDARAVLYTCEEERLLARSSFRLFRANETVVSYGTPGPSGDPVAQREVFLQQFPQLRGKRCLLFLSRLHPKKGCDMLIEAFATIRKDVPDLHLILAGPDQVGLRDRLSSLIERLAVGSHITWTGMLRGDLKWGAFYASEAFVLPSHQENFGIAVSEALACGLPVLISNKVNIWREIEADDAGIVGDDTLTGTIDTLRKWLSLDVAAKDRFRHNAVGCFRRRFHIEAASRSIISAIEKGTLVKPSPAAA